MAVFGSAVTTMYSAEARCNSTYNSAGFSVSTMSVLVRHKLTGKQRRGQANVPIREGMIAAAAIELTDLVGQVVRETQRISEARTPTFLSMN